MTETTVTTTIPSVYQVAPLILGGLFIAIVAIVVIAILDFNSR